MASFIITINLCQSWLYLALIYVRPRQNGDGFLKCWFFQTCWHPKPLQVALSLVSNILFKERLKWRLSVLVRRCWIFPRMLPLIPTPWLSSLLVLGQALWKGKALFLGKRQMLPWWMINCVQFQAHRCALCSLPYVSGSQASFQIKARWSRKQVWLGVCVVWAAVCSDQLDNMASGSLFHLHCNFPWGRGSTWTWWTWLRPQLQCSVSSDSNYCTLTFARVSFLTPWNSCQQFFRGKLGASAAFINTPQMAGLTGGEFYHISTPPTSSVG